MTLIPSAAFPLSTSGVNIVGADSVNYRLAGVNWEGAHQDNRVAGGLDKLHRSEIIGRIDGWGMNLVRFPFSTGMINNKDGTPYNTAIPLSRVAANPDLAGMTPWQAYQQIVTDMTAAGLYVIVNQHMLYPGWCPVPESTQILTEDGWKYWHELSDGDRTLGYDAGELRWTPVLRAACWGPREVVRIGNSMWSAVCTPEHKWLARQPRNRYVKGSGARNRREEGPRWQEPQPISASDWQSGTYQLQLTGYAEDGKNGCTPAQAAVIAWILADGSAVMGGRNSAHLQACIYQKKEPQLSDVRALLEAEGAYSSEAVDPRSGVTKLRLKKSYIAPLWQVFKPAGDPVKFVLGLSAEARAAWLDAWIAAEGEAQARRSIQIAQNSGELLDAIALTAYLEGYLPRISRNSGGNFPGSRNDNWMVVLGTKTIGNTKNSRAVYESAGIEPVWCPTTALGTFTARDKDGRIFLTGNCSGDDKNGLWYNDNWPASTFTNTWIQVATAFAPNPMVGFDIHNEPRPAVIGGVTLTPTWGDGNAATDFRLMYQNTIGRIRDAVTGAGSPVKHLAFCEGLAYAGDLTGWLNHPVTGANVVPSMHDYSWYHKKADGTQQNLTEYYNAMDGKGGYLVTNGTAPLWIGEFGQDLANRAAMTSGWMANFFSYAQARNLHWCWWSLSAQTVKGTEPSTNILKVPDGNREGFGLMCGQDWEGSNSEMISLLQDLM